MDFLFYMKQKDVSLVFHMVHTNQEDGLAGVYLQLSITYDTPTKKIKEIVIKDVWHTCLGTSKPYGIK